MRERRHRGCPPGATPPHLLTFVSDWYRWQTHMRRGGSAVGRGGVGGAVVDAVPSAVPRVPGLQMSRLSAPSYQERAPGSESAQDDQQHLQQQQQQQLQQQLKSARSGGGVSSLGGGGLGGWVGDPIEPAESARSDGAPGSSRRASSSGDPDHLTESEILHELSQTISPQELESFASAAFNGERAEISNLNLSPQRLAVIGKSLELISGRRCPSLMKQKRDYIIAWWRLALARSAHETLINSPQPATPVRRQDFNPLHFGEQQQQQSAAGQQQQQGEPVSLTPTQRAALKRLLDGYGAPRPAVDGAWEVLVPNEHLHIVCSQVSQLTGQSTPRQPRARREWLADVVRQIS